MVSVWLFATCALVLGGLKAMPITVTTSSFHFRAIPFKKGLILYHSYDCCHHLFHGVIPESFLPQSSNSATQITTITLQRLAQSDSTQGNKETETKRT